MKTAGVVFDFYDDPDGKVLKDSFPTAAQLPDFIKTAHILNLEEREVLRDEAYALVMKNGGDVLRKYACVDQGNTFMSALYFAESMDYLPPEAQKIAAVHLQEACERYGFDIPFIKEAAETVDNEKDREPDKVESPPSAMDQKRKRASGMSRTRDSMMQPIVGEEADWAARTNLLSVRGGNDGGRVIPTANQMKTAESEQWVVPPAGIYDHPRIKALYKKHKRWDHPEIDDLVMNPHKLNETKTKRASSNFVDVSGEEPAPQFQKRAAKIVALDRYPLDSYADVREAVKYFEQSWSEFEPQDRHEFCKVASPRAQEIGLDVPELMLRYGSTGYAPDVEAHLANRKGNCDPIYHEMYDSMKEKRAEIEPDDFADLLVRADVVAGLNWYWGGAVADPWYATFGGGSEKEKVAYAWEGRGENVTEEELVNLASNRDLLLGTFEKDIVYAFQKDPVTIFESLPDDHKLLMARMATGG